MGMKMIISILFSFTLTTAIALAADYHLFSTQLLDDAKTFPRVWVLIQPGGQQPMVFQELDSKEMESWLRLNVRGSVLHFHLSPVGSGIGSGIFQLPVGAFKAFCETNDIIFVDESLKD